MCAFENVRIEVGCMSFGSFPTLPFHSMTMMMCVCQHASMNAIVVWLWFHFSTSQMYAEYIQFDRLHFRLLFEFWCCFLLFSACFFHSCFFFLYFFRLCRVIERVNITFFVLEPQNGEIYCFGRHFYATISVAARMHDTFLITIKMKMARH